MTDSTQKESSKRQLLIRLVSVVVILVLSAIATYGVFVNEGKPLLQLFNEAKLEQSDGSWQAIKVNELSPSDAVQKLRLSYQHPDQPAINPPYAIWLAGPFSARVSFDGEFIGTKGEFDEEGREIAAGPIDSVFYIADHLITPGEHIIEVEVISSHLNYTPAGLFHHIGIGGFDDDERRSLRHYAIPVFVSSALAFLVIFFIRVSHSSGHRPTLLLALAAGFGLLQLVFEVSRSFYAYPYDWHLLRSFGIWLFNLSVMLSLVLWCVLRLKQRNYSFIAVTVFIIALGLVVSIEGYDGKTLAVLYLLSLIPILGAVMQLIQRHVDLLLLTLATTCGFWLCMTIMPAFFLLDSIFFSSLAVGLGYMAYWLNTAAASMATLVSETQEFLVPQMLLVKHPGKTLEIDVSDILFAKAEGNYAEITLKSGERLLHHQRLGQLLEQTGSTLLRVHRSYLVNPEAIDTLHSREGSRYHLKLGEQEIPVSRYRVADLRERL